MIKAIAVVLVSILAAPSSALAQATTVDARQAAIVQVPVSGQSSRPSAIDCAGAAVLTEHPGTTSLQPRCAAAQFTWAGRHPVAPAR